MVNRDPHLDNGFLLVKEDERLASPLAVLYYEEYNEISSMAHKIESLSQNIQCVVSKIDLPISPQQVSFGQSQQPQLWDYADGIDTMEFLRKL